MFGRANEPRSTIVLAMMPASSTRSRIMQETSIVELDARGLMCPEPIALAQSRIAGLRPGEVLRVLTTDPAAPIDFEVWCLRRGHRFIACVATPEGHEISLAPAA